MKGSDSNMNSLIRKIIADDVLYDFNYEGKLNKYPLSEYTMFSKHLKGTHSIIDRTQSKFD